MASKRRADEAAAAAPPSSAAVPSSSAAVPSSSFEALVPDVRRQVNAYLSATDLGRVARTSRFARTVNVPNLRQCCTDVPPTRAELLGYVRNVLVADLVRRVNDRGGGIEYKSQHAFRWVSPAEQVLRDIVLVATRNDDNSAVVDVLVEGERWKVGVDEPGDWQDGVTRFAEALEINASNLTDGDAAEIVDLVQEVANAMGGLVPELRHAQPYYYYNPAVYAYVVQQRARTTPPCRSTFESTTVRAPTGFTLRADAACVLRLCLDAMHEFNELAWLNGVEEGESTVRGEVFGVLMTHFWVEMRQVFGVNDW